MPHTVVLAESFEADVSRLFDWLFGFNSVAAFRFRDAVETAVLSLSEAPTAYSIASDYERQAPVVRRKLFKSGVTTYRLLFAVYEAGEIEPQSPPTVRCLRVLHGAARPLNQENETGDGA